MSGPVETKDLVCPCSRRTVHFLRVFKLRYHPNMGMREEPSAWQCVACGEQVDTQAMIRQDYVRRKEAELAELQSEVEHAP